MLYKDWLTVNLWSSAEKKQKSSILARDSPRHLLLPTPKGTTCVTLAVRRLVGKISPCYHHHSFTKIHLYSKASGESVCPVMFLAVPFHLGMRPEPSLFVQEPLRVEPVRVREGLRVAHDLVQVGHDQGPGGDGVAACDEGNGGFIQMAPADLVPVIEFGCFSSFFFFTMTGKSRKKNANLASIL